jgi:outer membrane protein TolC
LTISASGGFQSTGLNLLKLPDSLWSVGPSLAFPLFEGGLRTAEEQSAWAKLHQTIALYRASVLGAFQDVQDQLSLINYGRQELADATAAVNAAQQTLIMATALYVDGAESYLEVVTAQTALLQAQQTVLDLQARVLEADVSLVRAVGGGWRSPDLLKPLPPGREAAR